MGAYPSTTTKHFLINLKNGMVVKAADAFKAEALPKLADRANQKLKAEVKEQVKVVNEDKEQNAEQKASLKEQLEQLTFTVENLNEFSVSEQGVTFLFDAGFPHVIQALQPAGEYFFTYRALGSFVKPNGPLAIFK
jgi:phosphoenolpyruvate synthase/pyruvate phosphate dikinase